MNGRRTTADGFSTVREIVQPSTSRRLDAISYVMDMARYKYRPRVLEMIASVNTILAVW